MALGLATEDSFNTIQDNIDLKQSPSFLIFFICFNTIQDNIDLKHYGMAALLKDGFNTIQDNIDLKPQILNL